MTEPPAFPPAPDDNSSIRRERILQRLRHLGPGPAALFEDVCRLVDHDFQLNSRSMLIFHLLRELESSVRAVLLPDESRVPRQQGTGTGHKDEVKAILAALSIEETCPAGKAWLKAVGTLQGRAHRRNLEHPQTVDADILERVDGLEGMLDTVLDAFEAHYLAAVERLEALAAKPEPTNADAKRLRRDFPQNQITWERFFSRLTNPAWLGPLRSEGFFADLPPVTVDEEGNQVSYLRWPASAYLARVAEADPEQVLIIARDIPETDNPFVNLDLVEAALRMPPAKAVKLASRAATAARRSRELIDPVRYAAFVAHCAESGDQAPALDLMAALIDETQSGGRLDEWEYDQILGHYAPRLAESLGLPWLEMLADLLDRASGTPEEAARRSGLDMSRTYCPTLEQDRPHPYQLREARLTAAVRDAARHLLTSEADLHTVLGVLGAHPWLIFRRLRLHVLEHHGDLTPALVYQALSDRQLARDNDLALEWLRLARARCEHLEPEQRNVLVQVVREGPDTDKWKESHRRYADEEISDTRLRHLTETWHRERYAAIRPILPSDLQNDLQRLETGYGPAASLDDIEEPFFWTPPSSVSTDELAALNTTELVARVRAFTPSADRFTGQSEGDFTVQLRAAINQQARAHSSRSALFADLDDAYLVAALGGFTEAIRRGDDLDSEALVQLAATATKRSAGPRTHDILRESAQLLYEMLVRPTAQPVPDPAEAIWRTLTVVLRTADLPAASDTDHWSDPRAQALRTMVAWAQWRRTHDADFGRLFGVLDELTEPESLAGSPIAGLIATVVGERFAQLTDLDRDWANRHAHLLTGNEPLARLAWEVYLGTSRYYQPAVELLLSAYRTAACTRTEDGTDQQEHLRIKLGSDILVRYWGGLIELEGEDSIIRDYYANSSGEALKRLAWSMTSSLRAGPDIPAAAIERVRLWWEWRRKILAGTPGGPESPERRELLDIPGALVSSGRFPATWCLDQLHELLQTTGSFGRNPHVFRYLTSIVEDRTGPVLNLLQQCLASPSMDRWLPSQREADISTLLRTGLQNPAHAALSRAIINRAAARGYQQFRSLLTAQPSDPTS
ncbi:hypothetical protein AB0O74_31250 [Streptomyces rubiginosohelvolus]|uniref:hypothetical protein n=1 Tax=Streptomyces rubiginosohelvolus TaxID=67362 RepID=UPI0034208070